MANIFNQNPRLFAQGPQPRFGNPVPSRVGRNRGARRRSGSAFDNPNDSFEDIFGTGGFSFPRTDLQGNVGGNFEEQFGTGEFTFPQGQPGQAPDFGNINQDFLTSDENRDAIFRNSLQGADLTPNQLEFFKSRRLDLFRTFEALGAKSALAGGNPADVPSFADFFGNFGFQRDFQSRTPAQRRGAAPAQFNQRVRFLN